MQNIWQSLYPRFSQTQHFLIYISYELGISLHVLAPVLTLTSVKWGRGMVCCLGTHIHLVCKRRGGGHSMPLIYIHRYSSIQIHSMKVHTHSALWAVADICPDISDLKQEMTYSWATVIIRMKTQQRVKERKCSSGNQEQCVFSLFNMSPIILSCISTTFPMI